MSHYPNIRYFKLTTALLLLLTTFSSYALEQSEALDTCLLEKLNTADNSVTVGEIRKECEKNLESAMSEYALTDTQTVAEDRPLTPLEARKNNERLNYDRLFAITAFKPNYFIGSYMKNPNNAVLEDTDIGDALNNEEAKFQISIKAPVWRNMFGSNNNLMVAYTSTSWWQVGNNKISSAFRETNYEPEIFVRHSRGPAIPGGKISGFDLGFNHQSNGRSQLLSRSWNRIMARAFLDFDSLAVELRAWYRLPEDSDNDDNPNMYRYYGYGDVRFAYAPNKNTFTALIRPGTEEFGTELTWSYPLTKSLRLYAQYWNGYGESLLDYDRRIQRIGIGFALNDYLQRPDTSDTPNTLDLSR